jgi:hypothetical protein
MVQLDLLGVETRSFGGTLPYSWPTRCIRHKHQTEARDDLELARHGRRNSKISLCHMLDGGDHRVASVRDREEWCGK